jgi:hypothetical protein
LQYSFKVREVDTLIWNHLVAVLTSPETLSQGLEDYLAQRERTDGPLRERLEVVQGLIADNKGQLDRLLNLYLSGDFPKDLLVERKKRLKDTITALEKEQDNLASHLDSTLLTVEKIEDIQQAFSELVMQGVDLANADFETKREIVHLLNVTVTLAIEEDQEVVYVHHTLDTDAKRLSIADCNTGSTTKKMPTSILSAFFIFPSMGILSNNRLLSQFWIKGVAQPIAHEVDA